MLVRFGNLTVHEFAARVGADFTDDEIALLEARRTDVAMFTDESFHIFDDPGISISIGPKCLAETQPVWEDANNRKPFNRPVVFYLAHTGVHKDGEQDA